MGGAGNYLFTLSESEITFPSFTADGGNDVDTVDFGAGTFDAGEITAVLSNMEELDFTAAGSIASLSLSSSDIQSMTDGNNDLTININSIGNSINLTDPIANIDTDVSVVGQTTYTIYDDALHTTELAELTVVVT